MEQQQSGASEEKKRSIDRDDVLYVAGAVLVVAGLALDGPGGFTRACEAAGAFCLVFPAMQLVAGFVRGLRAKKG